MNDVRHERALARVNAAAAEARIFFRTVGPQIEVSTGSSEKLAIMRCPVCTPEPTVHQCPKCQWETPDRWRLKLHFTAAPQWCEQAARQRATAWANS